MTPKELTYLIEQYAKGGISPEKRAELEAFLSNLDMEVIPDDLIKDWLEQSKTVSPPIGFETTTQSHLDKIFSTDKNLDFSTDSNLQQSVGKPRVHRLHFLKTAWVRYAAAIIILFGIGAYLWNTTQKKNPQITEAKPAPVQHDIQPGKDRAILTLSNGQQVVLDKAASETIKDGTLSIENNDGQLIYKKGDKVAMNTMSTPKGGQYQLTLADGTKVWLNAASSITYPTAFTGTSREVTVTGEAYFQVTANAKQPFHVKTSDETITVLGTEFNVNTYEVMKTSLVTGSVKIGAAVLKPGQAYSSGKVSNTNIDQDIAWKNGYFSLEGKSVREIMQELSRWYDIEVVYDEGVADQELAGKIGRNLNLSDVIDGLQKLGIKLRIEGTRRVVVVR